MMSWSSFLRDRQTPGQWDTSTLLSDETIALLAVPEPSSLAMVAAGAVGAVLAGGPGVAVGE
jgi:hypothetical protein